ncbi:hypothetical protein D9757_008745 [Collybiopsis confluens]|uniref:ABC transporter domain-containing protein n=1 Tax=Collybiopsis confluens TaxID=2823264 RepID=A0A8H5H9H7_9AGAR|nr:hypothetical protein D9757_008745 [Collybiopsis confluens]
MTDSNRDSRGDPQIRSKQSLYIFFTIEASAVICSHVGASFQRLYRVQKLGLLVPFSLFFIPQYRRSSPQKMEKGKNSTSSKPQANKTIKTLYIGVYRVLMMDTSIFTFDYAKWLSNINMLFLFIQQVYEIAPHLVVLSILLSVLKDQENVVFLVFETRILRNIELALKEGTMDMQAIARDIGLRVLWVVGAAVLERWIATTQQALRTRVISYYDGKILAAKLKTDLPTLDENLSDDHVGASAAWYCLNTMISLLAQVMAIFSQLAFILRIARSNQHGLIYASLCTVKPILHVLLQKSLWTIPRVVEAIDVNFLRMRALRYLGENKFRLDVISGDIEQYIMREFRRAQKLLGDTPTESPEIIDYSFPSLNRVIPISLTEDLPMFYLVLIAFLKPRNMSLATIALLQESSGFLKMSFSMLFHYVDSLRQRVGYLEQLFSIETKAQAIKDGALLYQPLAEEKGTPEHGLHIELRNVSFAYPGTKTTKDALSDVSLTIHPGQLVVIVGGNGSGKSTLLKLLTRLYDVNSGSILINTKDIRSYKLASIRQSMATLSQDHQLFPLSVGENIGLGFSDKVDDECMIGEAAKKGGAEKIIQKFDKGLETVLEPRSVQYSVNAKPSDDTLLGKEMKALEKTADVSGGERQRLVASRTFMRLNSGKIRFMAVDEPSSALDPEGELELFNNFRAARQGKTMVFITHRFGHLTKYADQIICMKEGKIIEAGVHAHLLALDGEYAKMYNIQAQAFEAVATAET